MTIVNAPFDICFAPLVMGDCVKPVEFLIFEA
jgi:hypothetical protein